MKAEIETIKAQQRAREFEEKLAEQHTLLTNLHDKYNGLKRSYHKIKQSFDQAEEFNTKTQLKLESLKEQAFAA